MDNLKFEAAVNAIATILGYSARNTMSNGSGECYMLLKNDDPQMKLLINMSHRDKKGHASVVAPRGHKGQLLNVWGDDKLEILRAAESVGFSIKSVDDAPRVAKRIFDLATTTGPAALKVWQDQADKERDRDVNGRAMALRIGLAFDHKCKADIESWVNTKPAFPIEFSDINRHGRHGSPSPVWTEVKVGEFEHPVEINIRSLNEEQALAVIALIKTFHTPK